MSEVIHKFNVNIFKHKNKAGTDKDVKNLVKLSQHAFAFAGIFNKVI